MPSLGAEDKRRSAKLASKIASILSSDVTQFAKQNLDPTKINMIVTNALDILQGMGLANVAVSEALSGTTVEAKSFDYEPQVGDKIWYGGQLYTVTKIGIKHGGSNRAVELKDKKGTKLITTPGLDPRWGMKTGKKLKSLLDVMWSASGGDGMNRQTRQLRQYLSAHPERKQAVIATLLHHGKRQLATAASRMVLAYHPLVGTTVWGEHFRMHIGALSIRLEEYPPGGKTRGKKTGVYTPYWSTTKENEEKIFSALEPFAKKAPKLQYKAAVQQLEKIISNLAAEGINIDIETYQQKAVDAPNPMEHKKAPKPFTNGKGVYIEFDASSRDIRLRDTNDPYNEPSAFTQGKMAYKKAVDSFTEWKDLGYREILNFWRKKGVKYHSYLAMD